MSSPPSPRPPPPSAPPRLLYRSTAVRGFVRRERRVASSRPRREDTLSPREDFAEPPRLFDLYGHHGAIRRRRRQFLVVVVSRRRTFPGRRRRLSGRRPPRHRRILHRDARAGGRRERWSTRRTTPRRHRAGPRGGRPARTGTGTGTGTGTRRRRRRLFFAIFLAFARVILGARESNRREGRRRRDDDGGDSRALGRLHLRPRSGDGLRRAPGDAFRVIGHLPRSFGRESPRRVRLGARVRRRPSRRRRRLRAKRRGVTLERLARLAFSRA